MHNIYLDYAATTPVDKRVAKAMWHCLTADDLFGNAASEHQYGAQAQALIATARQQVAELINADSNEIIFTSGATEANNLAIKGVARHYQTSGKHIITSKIEHKSVLESCAQLAAEGFEITYLTPNKNGVIDVAELIAAVRDDTILISVMYVNNETGAIQNIPAIAEFAQSKQIILHVDAVQAIGKFIIDLKALPINLLSLSAHKIYGPKGIGALFIRNTPKIRLQAQMHGGGHEFNLRSGTLPTHQIVGMGMACNIAQQQLPKDNLRINQLRHQLWTGIQELPAVYLNTDLNNSVSNILNVSFGLVQGEALQMALHELAVSSGAACTSANLEPSYVLHAMGVADELAQSAIRFSLGRMTTEKEIKAAIKIVRENVMKLREISPLTM